MPQILGKDVGPIGFGLMGFTWRENPCSLEQAFQTMRAALKNGSEFLLDCYLLAVPTFLGHLKRNDMVIITDVCYATSGTVVSSMGHQNTTA